jgi:hypothetical protein
MPIVFYVSDFSELVHELVDTLSCGADHHRESFLIDRNVDEFRFCCKSIICQSQKYSCRRPPDPRSVLIPKSRPFVPLPQKLCVHLYVINNCPFRNVLSPRSIAKE